MLMVISAVPTLEGLRETYGRSITLMYHKLRLFVYELGCKQSFGGQVEKGIYKTSSGQEGSFFISFGIGRSLGREVRTGG